jgi:enediyne polyketide synthase
MSGRIAVVGMACRYPDAESPKDLWENVLARRRAFRRLPRERVRLEDYWSPDHQAPDRFYATQAAVIEGYEFDRVAFRVAGSTFRSTDLAHWLALDVAAGALADAGFPDGAGLPRPSTGVLVGNTLTGEFSRANTLRLRWPYVHRTVAAALNGHGWSDEERRSFLAELEECFKAPFPPVDGDTLAGALSNTIAGRICNHFDLGGGGYTVDGACAASLLAVTTACTALAGGDLDVAIAGGVDLSIDPFELVGFAKAGALAVDEMRVYDRRSSGFWPGEGCGMVVLMRERDARTQSRRIYAFVRGWGVSSDGSGGITRPEAPGQLLAIQRAYRRAGVGIDTVGYFEGHGTGTVVGDTTELEVLSRARREADLAASPAALGSIKANIGHTKAAAGIAGLIKATMAVRQRVLPPTTGCVQPHPLLAQPGAALRVLPEGEPWPTGRHARAAVSSMGFGGINAHVVLEAVDGEHRATITPRDRALLDSAQDAELLLFAGDSAAQLGAQIARVLEAAPDASLADLADLAAWLERRLGDGPVRAAVVASTPAELTERLQTLAGWLANGVEQPLAVGGGVLLGHARTSPRIGYLFPGQGSGADGDGGALRRRFPEVRDFYGSLTLPQGSDHVATETAQPRIVAASLGGLRALALAGVAAEVAVGHSLGELTALYWAGACNQETLLRIALARGRIMREHAQPGGAMASLRAGGEEVQTLLDGHPVVLAGLNGPRQTVVSGPCEAIDQVVDLATRHGIPATRLSVSHAFHSPLVAPASGPLAEHLASELLRPLRRLVISTVTGRQLPVDADLRRLLRDQVTSPVRFAAALAEAAARADLLLEVGPGRVLGGLAREQASAPVISLDTGSDSLAGYLEAIGAAWVIGHPVRHTALFDGRLSRPFSLEEPRRFLRNPCELMDATAVPPSPAPTPPPQPAPAGEEGPRPAESEGEESTLDLLRRLVASQAELPEHAVRAGSRLLDDLHLSSIAVGEVVVEACQQLGLPIPAAPANYAAATLLEVAEALDGLRRTAGSDEQARGETVVGVAPWVRSFSIEMASAKRPVAPSGNSPGTWQVVAPARHPLARPLGDALERAGIGRGILACLPPDPGDDEVGLLFQAVRAALEPDATGLLVLVHHGGGAALAKTLHLEAPAVRTCVVDVPLELETVPWVVAEAAATTGFSEARYSPSGERRVPVLRALPLDRQPHRLPVGPGDVVLVTGGGKGITAECALGLARETGSSLALLGRSDPAVDTELAANLERLAAAGVSCRYLQADVTDEEAVRAAVAAAALMLGPITGVLHGAGTNHPALLGDLDEAAFRRALAPKVAGLGNVLRAVDPWSLRLLVTFGSIIGRAGLPGEGAYAVANERMTTATEQFAARHAGCRCLAVEWSVWSGVGMGERLGAVEALARQGITPIPPDQGVAILLRLLAAPGTPTTVVVTGRLDMPTVEIEAAELPLLRFLERPRVHYPGVELVADAELSTHTDPYLDEHVLDGQRLLPAVIGLEAMAQAATALAGMEGPPVLERVRFTRPITIPRDRPAVLRVAALLSAHGTVEVVLRSGETGFQVDHFRATCRFAEAPSGPARLADWGSEPSPVPLDPSRDLYGSLLFQAGRFRRLRRYRRLEATACVAEVTTDTTSWFAQWLPDRLIFGAPGSRDACMHAIQSCVPDVTLLPAGVERLSFISLSDPNRTLLVHGRERHRRGDAYVWDLEVTGEDGQLLERWEGLRLESVRGRGGDRSLPAVLVGPLLERRSEIVAPQAGIRVVVEPPVAGRPLRRREASEQALQRVLEEPATVRHRPDGKPEVAATNVSAAHGAGLTLVSCGPQPLACDLEVVVERPPTVWEGLLGAARLALARRVAAEASESETVAATRVWSAMECARKAGCSPDEPLTVVAAAPDGTVVLGSGAARTVTVVSSLREVGAPVVFAILPAGGATG